MTSTPLPPLPLIRVTASLDAATIDDLNLLSAQTGVARSELIRQGVKILLDLHHAPAETVADLCEFAVKTIMADAADMSGKPMGTT